MAKYRGNDALGADWNPLEEDYNDDQFNSYDRGPGRDLPKRSEKQREVSLYITGIPTEMSDDGLMNLFSKAGACISAKKMKSKKGDNTSTYGFVKMACLRDGAEAIRLYDGFRIGDHFQLHVQFSRTEEERSRQQAQQMAEDEFLRSLGSGSRRGGSKHSSDSEQESRNDFVFSTTGERIMFGKTKVPSKMTNGVSTESLPTLQASTQLSPSSNHGNNRAANVSQRPGLLGNHPEGYSPRARNQAASAVDSEIFHTPASRGPQAGSLSERFKGIGRGRGVVQEQQHYNRNPGHSMPDNVVDLTVTVGGQDMRHIHGRGRENAYRENRGMQQHPQYNSYGGPIRSMGPRDRYQNYEFESYHQHQSYRRGGYGRGTYQGAYEYQDRRAVRPGANYNQRYYNEGGYYDGRYPYQPRYSGYERGSLGYQNRQWDGYTGGYRNNYRGGHVNSFGRGTPLYNDYARDSSWQQHQQQRGPKFAPPGSETVKTKTPAKSKNVNIDIRPCNVCKKIGSFQCSRCKTPYCCAACQKEDWPTHKHECQQISSQQEFAERFENQFDVSVGEDMVDKFKDKLEKYVDSEDAAIAFKPKVEEKSAVATNTVKSDKSMQRKQTSPRDAGVKSQKVPVSHGMNSAPQEKKASPKTDYSHLKKQAEARNEKVVQQNQGATQKMSPVAVVSPKIPSVNITRTEIELGVELDVIVLDVQGPDCIIIQLLTTEAVQGVPDLGNQMKEAYSDDTNQVTNPVAGNYYAGLYQDGSWYRACVKKVTAPDNILVSYIDYGNKETLTTDRLRHLKPHMAELPGQAIHCCLDGIKSADQNAGWSEAAVKRTLQLLPCTLINSVTYKLTGTSKLGNKVRVKILDANGCDVSQQLMDAGLALSSEKQQDVASAVDSDKTKRVTFKAKDLGSVGDSLNLEDTALVYITERETPLSFYLQIFDTDLVATFGKFEAELQEIYSAMESDPFKPNVGDLVVGQYVTDNHWYRAEVLELTNTSAKLRYIDFGNSEELAFSKIKPAVAFCCKLPAQSFRCELVGVSDALESARLTSLSPETLEVISEVTAGNQPSALDAVVKFKSEDVILLDFIANGASAAKAICESIIKDKSKGLQTSQAAAAKAESPPPKVIMAGDVSVVELPRDGATVDMVMTDLIGLNSFCMRKADDQSQGQLLTLMEAIDKYCKSHDTPYKPAVGEMVCSQFSADGAWYRGKVLSLHDNKYTVQYVDYGNCEEVTVDVIRKFDASLAGLPLQAVHCKLAGITEEIQTEEMLPTFAALVMGVSVKVQLKKSTLGTCEVLIFTSDGININEELIKNCTSTQVSQSVTTSNETTPSVPSVCMEKDLPDIPIQIDGSKIPAIVTDLNSLDSFYVKVTTEESNSQLVDLMAKIKSYCESNNIPHTPIKDELVCAKFSIDGEWYRAQVVDFVAGTSCQVQYVDYGNSDIANPDSIRKLDPSFASLPKQAIHCKLSGVCFDGQPEESLATFAQYVSSSLIEVQVDRIRNDTYEVVIFTQDGTNVNDKFKIIEPVRPKEIPQPQVDRCSVSNTPEWENVQKVEPTDSQFSVVITTVINPGEFYCQLASEESVDKLAFTMQNIMLYCGTEPADENLQLKVGDLCCAFYDVDAGWYRSVVLEKCNNNTYQVQYVDFGNKAFVPVNKIRRMQSEYLELPVLAFRCALHDVAPVGSEWSAESTASMQVFQDRALTAHLVKKSGNTFIINLTDDGLNIAQHLSSSGGVKLLSGPDNTQTGATGVTESDEADQAALIQQQIAALQAKLQQMQTK